MHLFDTEAGAAHLKIRKKLRIFLPLGCHLQVGGLLYSTKKVQGRRRTRGSAPLGPAAARLPPLPATRLPFTAASAGASFGRASTSPPWVGTSPSSTTTPPYYPYCNLLENMMCGTIYYFPMIYCIYVHV
jgi:hypothetical protein